MELSAAHEGEPPKEFLLADEHLGPRTADHRQAPTGTVSTYRLVGRDEGRGGFVYRLAPGSSRLSRSPGRLVGEPADAVPPDPPAV